MKSIKRKLNNKGGATLLIILVGMLLAVMVSVVLVTASVTSAKRVIDDRKKTQAYLTLESASKIVRNEMAETLVNYTVDDDGKIISDKTSATGKFKNEMISVISSSETTYKSSEQKKDFKVNYDEDEVSVSFEVTKPDDGDDEYKITFTFSVEDSDLKLIMVMDGQRINAGDENSYTFGGWTFDDINKIEE